MDDTTRDPQLAAALRRAEPEPPYDQVDWNAVRARANDGAALALARLRAEHAAAPPAAAPPLAKPAPRRRTLHWLVPLAAAAGVGGLMLARLPTTQQAGQPGEGFSVVQPVNPAGDATIDAILDASIPDRVDRAIDGDDQDALASGALGG